MIEKIYKDFDDLYLSLNWNLLNYPEEYIRDYSAHYYFLKPLYITTNSYEINLDFSFLGYRENKFYMLRNTYLNLDSWIDFKNKIKKSRSRSITFYFNQVKKTGINSDNSPCILEMVFSRDNRDKPYNEVTILYRAVEINRTFLLDLVLFNKRLYDIKDLTDVKKVNFFFVYPFIDSYTTGPFVKYLDLKLDPENELCQKIQKDMDYIEFGNLKFAKNVKMQDVVTKKVLYLPIDPASLDLYKKYEKKEKEENDYQLQTLPRFYEGNQEEV